jgi:hypothetical protein
MNKGAKVVLVEDGLGSKADGNHHVLGSFENGIQVEVLDIHAHKQGVGSRDDTVKYEFGGGESSGFCTNITGVINEVSTNGPTDLTSLGFLWAISYDITQDASRLLCGLWGLGRGG